MPPRAYIDRRPNDQSVRFGGKAINLSKLARDKGFDRSYLAAIFNYRRIPSIPYATLLAEALGMTPLEFLRALEERKAQHPG